MHILLKWWRWLVDAIWRPQHVEPTTFTSMPVSITMSTRPLIVPRGVLATRVTIPGPPMLPVWKDN